MTWLRAVTAGALIVVALVLQVSLFPAVAGPGVAPNLCLLVVVGTALTRGPRFAMTLGFTAGVLLDLAPPADHVAGRWALALVLVGYVAGRVRQDVRPTTTAVVTTVAASSFLGTSVFALTGLVLGDLGVGIGGLLQVIGLAVLWDVLLTPFVLPLVIKLMDRLERHGVRMRVSTSSTTMRLVVIQVLVFSLFATLFVRLYYLQVVGGADYQAQAASQSVREIVEQPPRGLVVDAMGRPLVANRSSWVVSVDRTMLGKMSDDVRRRLVARVARTVELPVAEVEARLLTCGAPKSKAGVCWNGSPFQPVPIATDVAQSMALLILEQPEDFPAVLAQQQSVRAYPRPYGINLAHVLGYLSPITEDELDLATRDRDQSVNGASAVGRAGVEKQYDAWLRGMPGYQRVAVDSMGRVLGEDSTTSSSPGATLVTSIDARVQSVVERQLHRMMTIARQQTDPVTRRKYVADSGAAVVLEARTGRVVAMASQPTYDPKVWVGGISEDRLQRLYSKEAGEPLLSRAMQGQFAPGSTWKPFMTAGALTNGYTTDTVLPCTSGLQVGNRVFKNFESGAYGSIGFAKALEVSCNTFFYRIGLDFWQRYGTDIADVDARDPLVEEAKTFGFGRRTGIDIPGEAAGRIADRRWKRAYFESQRDYYCALADKPQDAETSDFVYLYAREFCIEGYAYRAGDAVNFAIGQGDTIVTPLQLARAYAAISNGGTLWAPRVGKAIVDADGDLIRRIRPKRTGSVEVPARILDYIDTALQGVSRQGTMAWKLGGFPLDDVRIRAKTGSAEVYGKQTTGWVASYTEDYVVVMMISQAGTGSGSTGDGIRAIWESLYGVRGTQVDRSRAAIPGVVAPDRLPTFRRDGSILPPPAREDLP